MFGLGIKDQGGKKERESIEISSLGKSRIGGEDDGEFILPFINSRYSKFGYFGRGINIQIKGGDMEG